MCLVEFKCCFCQAVFVCLFFFCFLLSLFRSCLFGAFITRLFCVPCAHVVSGDLCVCHVYVFVFFVAVCYTLHPLLLQGWSGSECETYIRQTAPTTAGKMSPALVSNVTIATVNVSSPLEYRCAATSASGANTDAQPDRLVTWALSQPSMQYTYCGSVVFWFCCN